MCWEGGQGELVVSEWHTLHMYTNCSCAAASTHIRRERERERVLILFPSSDLVIPSEAAQLEICNMIADRHSQASGQQSVGQRDKRTSGTSNNRLQTTAISWAERGVRANNAFDFCIFDSFKCG